MIFYGAERCSLIDGDCTLEGTVSIPRATPESIGVINHTIDDEVCGATVQFGALNLNLGLGVPEKHATVQPASYRLDRPPTDVQKYIELAWPEDGHEPISYSNLG